MGDTKHVQDTFDLNGVSLININQLSLSDWRLNCNRWKKIENNTKGIFILKFVIVIASKSTPFTLLFLPLECYQRKTKKLKGILRYHTQYCCCNVKMIKSRFWTLAVFDKPWFAKSNCTLLLIRESCRNGADVQYMQYLSKSCITSLQIH